MPTPRVTTRFFYYQTTLWFCWLFACQGCERIQDGVLAADPGAGRFPLRVEGSFTRFSKLRKTFLHLHTRRRSKQTSASCDRHLFSVTIWRPYRAQLEDRENECIGCSNMSIIYVSSKHKHRFHMAYGRASFVLSWQVVTQRLAPS